MNHSIFTYTYDGETDSYKRDDPTDAESTLYNYEGWIASLFTTTYSTGGYKEFTLYNGFTEIYSKRYELTGSNVESSDLRWPLTIGRDIIMTADEIFILETETSLNIEASGTSTPNAMDVFLLDDGVSVSGDRCRTVTVNRKTTASAIVIGDTCYIFTTEA